MLRVESYDKNEIPMDIVLHTTPELLLFPGKEIKTDSSNAKRVLTSIPKKMGNDALDFCVTPLTCLY